MTEHAPQRRIEQDCYWLARSPVASGPALAGDAEVDVAIVGAGLTGLWTALHLKRLEPGLTVAVLEQWQAAFGASGRNAGMLSETIDHSHLLMVAHFGPEEATRLAALGSANLAELTDTLRVLGIDCDLERTGLLQVALHPSQLPAMRAELECAHRLGMTHLGLLDAAQARAELRCERYHGALYNPHAAALDPVKLVLGLKAAVERDGARVFERTRVRRLGREGAGVLLETGSGRVRTRRVILAANAYSHLLLPRLRLRYLPLFDYVLASAPLTAAEREVIGWRKRQSVTDVRAFFKYYRLTADDRIVWGTSDAAYYPPNRVDAACDRSPHHFAELRQSFARHFPELASLAFPYAWGGPIDATTRFTPFFGSALGRRLLYGLGFTGHGLGTTHLGAKILAHQALERPTELDDLTLVRRPPFPYPPEPLRRWAVAAASGALRRVDAGERPGLLLRLLDAMGIGLSS